MGGLRYEAWTLPWSGTFERVIADIPVVEGQGQGLIRFNDFGSGSIGVPYDYDRITDIISDTGGSLIRVYDGSTIIHEFLAERVDFKLLDEGITKISGDDLASAFDRAIIYPFDYPDNPTRFPNHIWGGANIITNPNFEDFSPTPTIWEVSHDATGGTFDVLDGVDTSTNAYNVSDSAFEANLETDITAITSVTVTGAGSAASPWRIEFVDPAFGVDFTFDSTALTGETFFTATLIQEGVGTPQGWTKSQQISFGTPKTFGSYDTFELSTDFADTGTYSLKIDPGTINTNGGNRYAGAQQVFNVKPGGTYQASIKIRPTSATDTYRFVIRTLDGVFIDSDTGGTGDTSYPTGSFSTVTISDLVIPDNVSQIIFRMANTVQSGDPATFYLDTASLAEGAAASTVGVIVDALMDDAATDHAADTRGTILDWVDWTGFTAVNDSSAVVWDDSLSFTAQRGKKYGQVFDDIRDLGYEWTLTPKASPAATTHDLNWYNDGNTGTDYSAAATPAVNVGQSTVGGPIVKRIPRYDAVLIEGTAGGYTETKDATAETNFGRLETYEGDITLGDATTRTAAADSLLAVESENRTALKIKIERNEDHPIPLVSYTVGDLVNFQFPPNLAKTARRVQAIGYRNTEPATYDVTGSHVFPDDTGLAEAVRKLIRRFEDLDDPDLTGAGVSLGTGKGGEPRFMIGASNASERSKGKSDAVVGVDGTADEILAIALAEWPTGQIGFTEGLFSFSADHTITDETWLSGQGVNATQFDWVGDPTWTFEGTSGMRDIGNPDAGGG